MNETDSLKRYFDFQLLPGLSSFGVTILTSSSETLPKSSEVPSAYYFYSADKAEQLMNTDKRRVMGMERIEEIMGGTDRNHIWRSREIGHASLY